MQSGARAAHFGEEGEELLLELLELPLSNSMEEERWRLEEGVEEHETAPLACHTTPPPPLPPSVVRSPWWAWPMLALSVCAVSSAGAAFKSFHSQHVPPVLLASWRLQVCAHTLSPSPSLGRLVRVVCEEKTRVGVLATTTLANVSQSRESGEQQRLIDDGSSPAPRAPINQTPC